MSAAYATFGLAPAMRAGGVLANGDFQVHRDFVDFIVDGRPLLFQLSDLDAVSPLASDVPPAIFTAQVRSLLLEAEPPLPGGRYVIYGCPECADLACGAVTAVIDKEDDDYIWQDFAWQTDEHADLELNGYHGIGPFRFQGAEYRAALGALLQGTAEAPRRRVLLIGARVALLAKLAAALRTIGIGADITHELGDVPPTNCAPTAPSPSAAASAGNSAPPYAAPSPTPGWRWRTSTASRRSCRCSWRRSNTPWTAAPSNSAA